MTTPDNPGPVFVPFVLTKRGKRTIEFAGDIAKLLGRKLTVVVNSDEGCRKLAIESGISVADEQALIVDSAASIAGIASELVRLSYDASSIPSDTIRITSESRNWDPNPNETTFFSADETGLFTRGKGPLYVPVGDKGTHPAAVQEAATLAKELGLSLTLYHSTWKNPAIPSDDPRDHTSEDALKVLSEAVRIANEAGVPVQIALEHAPTIVEGVLQHAIEHGASAIVMTKSMRARRGSYVDQVVAHSPVPVLVVPCKRDGKKTADLPPASDNLPFFMEKAAAEAPGNIGYYIMLGVLLMYIVKVIAKVGIGNYLHSPVIAGDGWHNGSDIFEALIVIATIFLANRPTSPSYPYGWKNLEHIFGVLVGLSLGWMGLGILKSSLVSIVAIFPTLHAAVGSYVTIPAHEPLLMGPQFFPWAVGVMGISVILSQIVARVQINCGNKYGYPSIAADGAETLSDGRIEGAALAGILSEYLFHLPQIEYFLGTIIAGLIFKASYEMVMNSVNGLLQHSIGEDKETEIRKIAKETRGIFDVLEMKTFITGSSAVVIMKAVTKVLRPEHLRIALAKRVIGYCTENGFTKAECHVRFSESHRPKTEQVERIAFAAIASTEDPSLAIVAPSFAGATHIVVADDEKYRGRRSFIDPLPTDIARYLAEKHVKKLYVYGNVSVADAKVADLPVAPVATYHLEILGA